MNPVLRGILDKHQRTPASPAAAQATHSSPRSSDLLPPRCPRCGTHGALSDGSCPFRSDEEIITSLVGMVVEEFSTRDAKVLVRLLCTEGARIALELHDAMAREDI